MAGKLDMVWTLGPKKSFLKSEPSIRRNTPREKYRENLAGNAGHQLAVTGLPTGDLASYVGQWSKRLRLHDSCRVFWLKPLSVQPRGPTAIRRTACDHAARWRRSPHRSARRTRMTILTHLRSVKIPIFLKEISDACPNFHLVCGVSAVSRDCFQ